MAQMLQKIDRPSRSGSRGPNGTRARMKLFLREYERQFGNVSITCANVHISRQTFYRWSDPASNNHLHKWFRNRLASIRPLERLLDAADTVLFYRMVEKNDLKAAIFVLQKHGSDRGWSLSPPALRKEETSSAQRSVEYLRKVISQRALSSGVSFEEELGNILKLADSSPRRG